MNASGQHMCSAENQHRDVKTAEIKRRDEKAVEKIKVAVQSFLNPFNMVTKDLVNLSFGATASTDVTTSSTCAEERNNRC